jgi:hypothetical protein
MIIYDKGEEVLTQRYLEVYELNDIARRRRFSTIRKL